jgi:hypothetical protein
LGEGGISPNTLSPFSNGGNSMIDNYNFLPPNTIHLLLDAFGWSYSKSNDYRNLDNINMTLLRADFYPVGHVLAVSKKAVIVCDGESLIEYKDEVYEDVQELIDKFGNSVIDKFSSWKFLSEKEWTVKKNGEYVHSFSSFKDIKHRKKLRC